MSKTFSALQNEERATQLISLPTRLGITSLLIAPLREGRHVLGAIALTRHSQDQFEPADGSLLEEMASYAAQALGTARLFRSERRERERTARLQMLTALLVEAPDPDSIAYALVEQGCAIIGAQAGACLLLSNDGEALELVYSRDAMPQLSTIYRRIPLAMRSVATDVLRLQQLIILNSRTSWQTRYPRLARQMPDWRWQTIVGVPLQTIQKPYGVVLFYFSHSHAFDGADREMLLAISRQCAQSLARIRHYEREQSARAALEQSIERLGRLQAVTAALSRALTPPEVAHAVVTAGREAFTADSGAVFLFDEAEQSFTGLAQEHYANHHRVHYHGELPGPLAEVLLTRDLVTVESAEELRNRWPHQAHRSSANAATITAPLLNGAQVIGALQMGFQQPHRFSRDDCNFIATLARQCAQALERARLYEAELTARRSAEQAVQLREQFFSVASHELRTPLMALLGNAELAQRRMSRSGEMSSANHNSLQVVVNQARRLSHMVNALLDMSRIDAGDFNLVYSRIELVSLLEHTISEIQVLERSARISLSAAAKPLYIRGDELRLIQVFYNLLSNSLKFSPNGEPIHIQMIEGADMVQVAVRDQGIGIPPEALPYLFERFYRAPNVDTQHYSGMGIGLYIAQHIINLHGGAIAAEAALQGGTAIIVTLPCDPKTATL